MRVSYNWLKELVNFDLSPTELAERLTMVGLEVSEVVPWGQGLDKVVVGQVLSVEDHPQADLLSICTVDVGSDRLQIACGAPNMAKGQKVPVALPGAVFPDGSCIERVELRGVESQGMICSERELGLSSEAVGIMVLDGRSKVGARLTEVMDLADFVLELDLTPNRPDCLSHIGVAREISALTGNPLRKPDIEVREGSKKVEDLVSVEIFDQVGCPRYAARMIEGVGVGPSPDWLRLRLESIGIRSVNNVVDVTNYVLMEFGHPLHAFDYNLLSGDRIMVRRAISGESIATLDGQERRLSEEILVITDGQKPVAIAGIMGGLNSEVTERTKNLLIESAYFDPKAIRRGTQGLAISTEASHRFERGANPEGVIEALDRATQLISKVVGGEVAQGIIDEYPRPVGRVKLKVRTGKVNQILGADLPKDEVARILDALGFKVEDGKDLRVTVPPFRPDVAREIDVVEEVARMYGYNEIGTKTRASGSLTTYRSPVEKAIREVKGVLTGLGMTEVVTNSLIDPEVLKIVDPSAAPLAIKNPLSRELSVLRPTLVPNILQTLVWNKNRKVEDLSIFELGRVFMGDSEGRLPTERLMVCGAMMGKKEQPGWNTENRKVGFFDLKGLLESFFERISLDKFGIIGYDNSIYKKGVGARIIDGQGQIGTFGEVKREILERFDLKGKVFLFDLDFEALLKVLSKVKRYQPLPRFPAVERDLAITVPEALFSGSIVEAIYDAGRGLVESVNLFDLYRGEQIPTGKKGLAYSLRYRSGERTLTDQEVDEVHAAIANRLKRGFDAEVRGE